MTSYDVFLSFRGSDTRQNFTSHLYAALRRKHIHTFIDENYLDRGEEISPTLLKTIQESKFSVIVFSQNYASSPWCLDELVKIMDCAKTIAQKAIPVFYHVDPSHVSDLTGKFGEAFHKVKDRYGNSKDRVNKWCSALEYASNLSGWDSSNYSNEAELIENVAEHIMQKLYPLSFTASNELVGMHSHTEHILSRLNVGAEDVRFLGLWGMGGVGKTTIAEILYSQISYQFDRCYFLRNVREDSEKNGLIPLRNQYFSQLLANKNISIEMLRVVPSFIKDSLSRMKVVIVLDDISDPSQLEALGVGEGWFGRGSRIILTSRDKKVLQFIDEIDIYHVEGLSADHALELFSMRAFKQKFPPQDYADLSEKVLHYAQGLPLALTVLGSHLLKRTQEEWEIELDKLKRFPDSAVHKILEISFEDLDNVLKDIFLDISCCLKGYKKDSVIDILDGYGFPTRWGINRLSEKCLISFNRGNVLQMHDLVQEMGQDIARRKGLLLNNKDIAHILKTNTWNTTVESVVLNMAEVQKTPFTFQTLSWMPKLRVLKISNVHTFRPKNSEVDRSPPILSSSLSLLHWHNYPFKSLRSSDSLMPNLVELIMPRSNVTELWNGNQCPENLKILDLQHSVHLTRLPDISSATKLEEIYLDYCKSLQELPPYIGHLKNLKILAVSPCENLTSIPSLNSLQIFKLNRNMFRVVLDARGCRNLREVPDNIMGIFTNIILDETAIQQLTVTGFSSALERLSMKNCEDLRIIPRSICELKYLYRLDLDGCLNLSKLPPLNGLGSLKWLSLEGSGIEEIPTDIVSLASLESLVVNNCQRLRSLPLLPWQLKCLEARNCTSLQAASVASLALVYFSNPGNFHEIYGDFEFNFCNCIKLDDIAHRKIMADARWRIEETALLPFMETRFIIRLPGSEIPEWFSHQTKGNSMIVQFPHFSYPSYLSLAFCIVIEFKCPVAFTRSVSYECLCSFRYNSSEEFIAFTSFLNGVDESDHVLLWCSNSPFDMIDEDFSGEDVLLQFSVEMMEDKRFSSVEFQVKRCGVYFVIHS